MNTPRHPRRPARGLLLTAALMLAPLTAGAQGDDIFLLTTSVAPNVVLLLDNSATMRNIEWHPAFDSDLGSYGCSDFDNNTIYPYSSAATELHCGRTRRIFAPANPTLWDGRYLNWYFSAAADPYINEIENAIAQVAGCNQAGAGTRFVDRYRRTRADAAKQVLLDALCVSEPKGLRFGLAEFRSAADINDEDPNGGFLSVAVDDPTPSHASDLEAHIGNTKGDDAKPLAEALFQISTYLMSRQNSDLPRGVGGTRFPAYVYDERGVVPNNSSNVLPDPVQFSCQKSFVVIVTDGRPSRDDFGTDPASTSAGFGNFNSLIGDYHADGEIEVPGDAVETSWYLDDVAKYIHENDLRPDFVDDQTVDVYTIGFNTDAVANAFLQKTADVGSGLFFRVQDGEELGQALVDALNDIIEKSRSFTAATVPSSRTADGGDFYNSFFLPSGRTPFWEGHLRSWHITATGDIHDKNGACALIDPDPGECNSGPFKPTCTAGPAVDCATPFWDAGEEIPAPGSRNLWVSKLQGGSPDRTPFDASLTPTDLTIAPFAAPPDPAPNSAQYPLRGSTALNEDGLAQEVVAYTRGCYFGTGATSDVASPTTCLPRPWMLGDIFHSDPIVVQHPRARGRGASYDLFKNAYTSRSRVIYAGANDGFLHAFHAGDWDGSATPPKYDEGSGDELFGFMPWQVRQNIKNLPVDPPTNRTLYVDGSPQVADVRMYPFPASPTGSEWRTVLIGGLRQGGSQYYALDITNPPPATSGPAGNLQYPGYLWEFPREDDPNDPTNSNSFLPYMGQTWGQPIITKVRVSVGTGIEERYVAVVTGGYHVNGDPNNVLYDPNAKNGRAIYLLDVTTGEVLAEKKFDPGAPDDQRQMVYAIAATPAVFDLDANGFADVIFVGDLGGNIWKWVINPVGEDRVNDNSGVRTQPAWPFQKFFSAPTATISTTVYYKSFFYPPAGALVSGKLWLAIGSGERADVGFAGIPSNDAENNRYYLMMDLDPHMIGGVAPLLGESDLTDATGIQGAVTFTNRGYFFRVADGEKFVTNSEIFAGLVIAASFTPTFTGDPCASRGIATLYVFELGNGVGYFTDGAGNPLRSISIGTGLPTDPSTSVGAGGSDNRIYIKKSDAELESIGAPNINLGAGIVYWRELR